MTGDIYSNMPDTTSRMAPYRRSIRRLIASMSLFASSLLLVASMGLAQSDDSVRCEDFTTPEDAQVALDEDPSTADALDGNGNGVACDEDRSIFTEDRELEERGEFADEIEGGNTDDAEDGSGASEDQAQQTPATGGIALLPLAGSALTAGFGGFMLLRRR